MSEDFNLEDDWAAVRGNGKASHVPSSPAVADELESSWNVLKNIPEIVYQAHEGYGVTTMSLFEYRCHGQRSRTMNGRTEDCWRVSFLKAVWLGSEATVHHSYSTGTTYLTSKKQIDLTLDEAIVRLEGFRQKHLKTLLQTQADLERQINERLSQLARLTESYERYGELDLIAEVKGQFRDQLRSQLLGVLKAGPQQVQERLLSVFEARVRQESLHRLSKMTEEERTKLFLKVASGVSI